MAENKKQSDDTIAVHAGRQPLDNFGVVNPPVYHASTILHPTLESWEGRNTGAGHKYGKHTVRYGLMGTPTTFALRDALTALDGAADTELVPSGLTACTLCFLALAEPGAHFLVPDNVYDPVRRFTTGYLTQIGCEVEFYNPTLPDGIANMIRPTTKMIWIEAPGSLTFEMPDIRAIVAAAKAANVLTGIDNTWGAGYFLKPIAMGIDFTAHALTKYPCGHSDTMLGSIGCATDALYELINKAGNAIGNGVSPDDCYLVQRGLRTMPTRMKRHHENGLRIARWLEQRPEVKRVMHPGLESDPGHALWKRDFTGACGLFGIVIEAPDRARLAAMIEGYDLFGIGASWGGFESLATTSYPQKTRTAVPWPKDDQVVRYHIGLEDPDDLIADLEAGFDRLAGR